MQRRAHKPRRHSATAWLTVIALSLGVPYAGGDDVRDLLEEALDQPVTRITINDQPLREALLMLEDQTGVRLEVADDVIALMPYGVRTRVSLTIEDLSLREGLRQLLDSLGLMMDVRQEHVELLPAPVLERIGRRMTVREVGLLGALASDRWAALEGQRVSIRFELDEPPPTRDELRDMLAESGGDNALRQWENVARGLGWVWSVDGDTVVVRTRLGDVQHRLDRTLDMSYHRVPLDELLLDLGRRAGLTMYFEPGALGQVSARERAVDLIQRDLSVRQTLELLCGNTGLRYEVLADGVHFAGPKDAAQPISKSPRLFRISIPVGSNGVTFDAIIREDELPPAVRRLFETKLEAWLDEMAAEAAATP